MNNRTGNYISYEYKDIITDSSRASFLLDGYECFGWELDQNLDGMVGHTRAMYTSKVHLRLKRNRKLVNKMELTRLQRNFESCVREIDLLEKSKTSKATVWALIIGIIGTAFMAGSVFSITLSQPNILLCIILAIPAFIGWILPYFVYKRKVSKETERITLFIEEKYDEIEEICEKGNKLLY